MAGVHRWQFTPEELQNTPSRKAGIDADKELNYRQQCANLIQDMGQRLNVTQLCINTAIVYMHRFYVFHSFTKFHRNPMASACLFLAAKVEEQPRKLEHVITWYHMCVNRDQGALDVKSEAYLEMAQELVSNENILLQTLGFDISVEHPHQNVVKTCTLVKASKDLAQTSYILATNSLHLTTMCLRNRHTVVACVCIHLACKWSNYQIPCSSEGKQWFEYVDKDTTLAELEELTNDFLTILDNCPSKLKKKILTWKSGNHKGDLPEELTSAGRPDGGDHSDRKKHPPSAAAGSNKDLLRGGSSHSSGSGLRRVQTEPALAQSDQKRSKKPSHPPPPHPHHREIPGYHGKPPPQHHSSSSSHNKHPYPTQGKPTHPPPSSKSRHPPPPSTPHASANSHADTTARTNIFDQMQNEQTAAAATQEVAGRKSVGPPQQQQRVHGSHHQKAPHSSSSQRPSHTSVSPGSAAGGGVKRSHGEEARPRQHGQDPVPSASVDPSASKSASSSTSKPPPPLLSSDKGRQQSWGSLEEGEIISVPESSFAPVSLSSQARQEREMQEKLQNEMRKQKERSARFEKERCERVQKEKALKSPPNLKSPTESKSPRLTSPPVGGATGRVKSDSTSSRSDSDTTPQQGSTRQTPTKEERLRLLKEHQHQIIQDDRKRLRRLSEELGDPKIDKKPVVMLDNFFTSPEGASTKGQDPSPKSSGRPLGTPSASQGAPVDKSSNVPTPSRTISLEKYRERKPLVPQPSQQSTPTGSSGNQQQPQTSELTPDKPSLAMEHLANIKLQGLKPLSEILKPSESQETGGIKEEEWNSGKAVKSEVSPSPRKVKSEKLQRHDSSTGKLHKMAASDHQTKQSETNVVKTELEHKSHKANLSQKSMSRQASSDSLQRTNSAGKDTATSVNALKQEVTDSPKKEKNIPSLKIKIGGKPIVTMSPGSADNKAPGEEVSVKKEHHHHHHGNKEGHHRHHEKKPHKHKHRDKSKHRPEREQQAASGQPSATANWPPTSKQVEGDTNSASGEKLPKLKLNLKQIGMSDNNTPGGGGESAESSPFKIDNPHRSLTGTPDTDSGALSQGQPQGQGQNGGAMKLVLQKDRSGQYSSGQKPKHSQSSSSTSSSSATGQHHRSGHPGDKSSRKRVHSPADPQRRSTDVGNDGSSPAVPLKIPRSDSNASLGYEVNGSRSNSPSQRELLEQQQRKVEKLIEKQRRNIIRTLEQQQGGSNTPTNSPRVNPRAYPP